MSAPAWQKALGGAFAGYAAWKYIDGKYNLASDIDFVKNAFPVMKEVAPELKDPSTSVLTPWYKTLAKPKQDKKVMFIQAETGRAMTFGEVEEVSNRIAHWAASKGFKAGDAVAVFMENRPEYYCLMLGFAKAGVVAAMINNNQKGKPLLHAVRTANSVGAVFGTEYADLWEEAVAELRGSGVRVIASYGAGGPSGPQKIPFSDESLDESLASMATTRPDPALRKGLTVSDPFVYIYTSGTTGLPKACNVSHMRLLTLGTVIPMFQAKENDIIYGSGMPMYHTSAHLGISAANRLGCTYIIRMKFSARHHFADCEKYGATAMQYIGELCRYLIATPEAASDKEHKVRIAIGSGLRPEIWDQFQRRFNIPEIGEFYGATEGNAATVNYCRNYQGQGAVGRAGALLLKAKPMNIVKFDVENEVPVRDPKTGFCIECDFDEPGELVAPIRKIPGTDHDDFEGYTSKEATEKKILRDVFAKGDKFFRTGDLLRRDRKGYFYFVDRIGDTFRWKGENVSTMEVSEVLSSFPGVVDANVYGVQVAGKDGRACMVAITLEDGAEIDPTKLATYVRANLPSYSIPVFARFLPRDDLSLTGTFKHQKVDYRNQGCDAGKVTDKMWWYVPSKGAYEPYGAAEFAEITAGRAKL